ncbi:hypothetical protein [Paenibacillus mendelii]|uniref:DUF4062 domain-containing protein n=1 Tax=Paenibacillus mendelii TaxID=206163 RepID=A0ABV6JBM8_9BACL|nr:hypothetical protein [Paenibacillus mendelii]MCQ6563873.1 hypothetical protein [Paenibacillus mendelii]
MSFRAEVLRVLIASPSDVNQERNEIEEVIFMWNSRFAEELETILLPGRWEEDVVPTYRGSDPQQIINEQLVNKCDILIGVFWTKLGTPTMTHSSGTLEEVSIFIEKGKEVMLYFVDKAVQRNADFSQLAKVDEFKKEYGYKGIYSAYDRQKIIDHLYKKVMQYKKKRADEQENVPTGNSGHDIVEPLKDLLESGKLTSNEILLLAYTLDTGNRQFGYRWMANQTLPSIQAWEKRNYLGGSDLSDAYNEVVLNLAERGLLEVKETTSYSNVRLYVMPLVIYDQLRTLSDVHKGKLRKVVDEALFPFGLD